MQRERPRTAAAPRDRLEGGAAGSMARSAVASEESCVRCNESQGVDKEPVPLTSGLTHEYSYLAYWVDDMLQAGVGDVRRAVAQAMRYAGCLNRRSLGVSDVFPRCCYDGGPETARGGHT